MMMVRYVGMDVHREFAQLAVVEDGIVRDEGRIAVSPEALRQWAGGLRADDEVALEATGNSDAIATLLTPLVGRVVVSNPSKTRAIAEAKVKTDKVDARILAQLLAADFLPSVWLPDDRARRIPRTPKATTSPVPPAGAGAGAAAQRAARATTHPAPRPACASPARVTRSPRRHDRMGGVERCRPRQPDRRRCPAARRRGGGARARGPGPEQEGLITTSA